MINDLDDVLRKLLIREIPIENGEVEIAFEQPDREWSDRLSRPTLNLFLHDVRENLKLRRSQEWIVEQNPDGTATKRRMPVRIDLHYMVTAWANGPDDEHRLLARTLMALFRHSHIPQDLLPESLQDQPKPIPLKAAQEDALDSSGSVWSALDNEMRPIITLMVTLAVDPYQPLVTPLVRTRELRVGQTAEPVSLQQLKEEPGTSVFWTVGGTLRTEESLEELSLVLVEQGRDVPIQEDGRFAIGKLRAGDYTLEVKANGRVLKRHPITVPAPDYELEV
jgi:hypothetical protein